MYPLQFEERYQDCLATGVLSETAVVLAIVFEVGFQSMKKRDCPNIKNHTDCPSGYLQWHYWAARKSRRHKQVRCPSCGLWAIWVRRAKDEPDWGGDEFLEFLAKD